MELIKEEYGSSKYTELRLYLQSGIDGYLEPLEGPFGSNRVVLFLKFYNPATRVLKYVGNVTVADDFEIRDILSTMRERAGLDEDTPLWLFEEVKPGMIVPLPRLKQTFSSAELGHGDILCFQRALMTAEE